MNVTLAQLKKHENATEDQSSIPVRGNDLCDAYTAQLILSLTDSGGLYNILLGFSRRDDVLFFNPSS